MNNETRPTKGHGLIGSLHTRGDTSVLDHRPRIAIVGSEDPGAHEVEVALKLAGHVIDAGHVLVLAHGNAIQDAVTKMACVMNAPHIVVMRNERFEALGTTVDRTIDQALAHKPAWPILFVAQKSQLYTNTYLYPAGEVSETIGIIVDTAISTDTRYPPRQPSASMYCMAKTTFTDRAPINKVSLHARIRSANRLPDFAGKIQNEV